MSAETVSSINAVELFVRLLKEGTEVLRPTTGLLLGPDSAQILASVDYDPTLEEWEFPPGSNVKVVWETRSGRKVLVARERLE
jgi:hypothetical protein